MVALHVLALHVHGSNNPLGVDVKGPQDTVPFHPYYTMKDGFGVDVFLIVYAGFVFFAPNFLGHADNYIPANPLVTPAHIVPEWYFLPFYAILRAIPGQAGRRAGDVRLDRRAVRPAVARHLAGALLHLPADLQVVRVRAGDRHARAGLLRRQSAGGLLGTCRPSSRTAYYFFHFLILLPVLGKIERPLPLPPSIADAVLKKKAA